MDGDKETARRDAVTGGADEAAKYAWKRDKAGDFHKLGKKALDTFVPISEEALVVLGKVYSLMELPYVTERKLLEAKFYSHTDPLTPSEEPRPNWDFGILVTLINQGKEKDLEEVLSSMNLKTIKNIHHQSDPWPGSTYNWTDKEGHYLISVAVSWPQEDPNET